LAHRQLARLEIFLHACQLGCEGIVSKRLGSRYTSGRTDNWIKVKNPAAPAKEAEKRKAMLAESTTFASVVEAYATRVLSKQRQGAAVKRRLDVEAVPVLGGRPIAQISQGEITTVIEKVMSRTTTGARARNLLADLKGLYGFVLDRPGEYGMDHAPTDRIKARRLIGKKVIRQRVLTDDELRKLWAATGQAGYPYGSLLRLIALTGCRVSELRCASWREIDMAAKTFTVPASRFKSGCQHIVPLSSAAMALLAGLPCGSRDGFVFSNLGGSKPVSRDKAVTIINKALGGAPGYTLHDIRRSVRTRLSPLAPFEVCEAVIGHAKVGLARVYDQHSYHAEKAAALQLWADTLLAIVQPSSGGDNVVPLRA
jgi:integrase